MECSAHEPGNGYMGRTSPAWWTVPCLQPWKGTSGSVAARVHCMSLGLVPCIRYPKLWATHLVPSLDSSAPGAREPGAFNGEASGRALGGCSCHIYPSTCLACGWLGRRDLCSWPFRPVLHRGQLDRWPRAACPCD